MPNDVQTFFDQSSKPDETKELKMNVYSPKREPEPKTRKPRKREVKATRKHSPASSSHSGSNRGRRLIQSDDDEEEKEELSSDEVESPVQEDGDLIEGEVEGYGEEDDDGPFLYPGAAEEDEEERLKKETPEEKAEREREAKADLKGESFVFIDNLPKEKGQIRTMMAEVKRHIMELEKQFFYEEDSDQEEINFGPAHDAEKDPVKHNDRLNEIKDKSNIQQFWCTPLSTLIQNDMAIKLFSSIGEAQAKHANGRLFDVITCDPPW